MSTFASPATAEATVAGAATAGTAAMIVEGAVLGLAQAMVLARAQPRLARVRPRSRPVSAGPRGVTGFRSDGLSFGRMIPAGPSSSFLAPRPR